MCSKMKKGLTGGIHCCEDIHLEQDGIQMIWELLFIFLIILIGGFVQGASGFGLGLVVMGFLPLMLTIKESTLIVIALLLVASLSILRKIYKHIELKGLIIVLSSALVGRVCAFFVLNAYGEMEIMKQWLGFFLIGMVIYLVLDKKKKDSSIGIIPIIPIILGFLSGFVGGVFAVGGPFMVFYFLIVYKDKLKYSANLQVTVVVTTLFSLILHGLNGDFNTGFYVYFFVGVVGVFIGTSLGLKWFEKLPNNVIRKFAMILVFIAALNLIIFS